MEYKGRIAVSVRVRADDQTDADRKVRLIAYEVSELLRAQAFPPFVVPEFFIEVEKVEKA